MVRIFIILSISLLLTCCRSATVATSSDRSSVRSSVSSEQRADTVTVIDTLRVRIYESDSVHYVITDHFRDRTRVVYRNRNDTVCTTDTLLRTVTIKEKTSNSNLLTTIWKYLLAVTVLLVLVFIIRMIIQRTN